MSSENIYRIINIDENSITAKYIQLTNAIVLAVEQGKLEKEFILPSINEMSFELDISRDTVEKAYKKLKSLGVVNSIPGKGYFISKTDFKQPLKVLLMFNKLSVHKKMIYDAFVETVGENTAIDFYIYNNDFSTFKKLIQNIKKDYSHYVIIPHFNDGGEKAHDILNGFTNGNLILLDKLINGISRPFTAVYENFEKDIFEALKKALPDLLKYNTLKIIFPSYTYFPEEILNGFKSFCNEFAFNYKVVHTIEQEKINPGEVYINLMEDDLVILLGKIKESNLKVGKEIGIISYNETPWKQFILEGITTISSDFIKMGKLAGEKVLNYSDTQLEVPFSLIQRSSL